MDNNYPQYYNTIQPQPNTLVFGILSIVLSGIVGLILAIIGRNKANAYIASGGTLTGTSKVGYILCKVGLILSIVAIVICAIYIIYAIFAVIIAAAGSYRY